MNIKSVFITPEVARKMLESNTANRPLSKSVVSALAGAMKRGEWKENGDTIRVGEKGVLLDGQHRLSAIVLSGISQKYIVVSDLEPETFKTIDQGRKRSASDMLAIGGAKHYTALANSARLHHKYLVCGNPFNGTPENAPTATQVIQVISETPELAESVNFAARSQWVKKYIGAGRAGFLINLFSSHNEAAADAFFSELESGMFSYANSPVLLLRDRLMEGKNGKTRMTPTYSTALIFKAFGSFLMRKEMKTLRVRTEGDAPEKDLFKLSTPKTEDMEQAA